MGPFIFSHPDDPSVTLRDRHGTPIHLGAECVIAQKASRYGGANLVDAVIQKVTPLVLHPRHYGQTWHSTGPRSRIPLVREDQLSRSHQTEYLAKVDESLGAVDLSTAFVASVKVPNRDRLITVPFGFNLIVKP